MKLYMNKKLKITLIFINLVALIAISVFLYTEYTVLQYMEEKVSLYGYSNKAGINYSVFLRPNVLYEEESLGEGQIYITEFVDYIQASFYYEFQGEREAEVKGEYEIIAEMEGYTGQAETYKTIWKKERVLSRKKNFQGTDKTVSINKDLSLDIHEYNDFVKEVIDTSKINSSVKLTVFMNVNVEASTDQGSISQQVSSFMMIPLNTNHFEISGDIINEKTGSIQETIKVQLPANKKKITLYGSIIGFLFILLVFLSFFTKEAEKKSSLAKKLKQIFKKHGDRLVALNTEVVTDSEYYREVKSIEDLVRIADELGKPIMYKYSTNVEEISTFYVFDDSKVFLLDIHKMMVEGAGLKDGETDEILEKHKSKSLDTASKNHGASEKDELKKKDSSV